MIDDDTAGKILATVARTEKTAKQTSDTVTALALRVEKLEERTELMIKLAREAFDESAMVNARFNKLTRNENEDTDPQAPESIRMARNHLKSTHDEDDRPSLLTQPLSVHAGKVRVRGPSVVVGFLVLFAALVAGAAFVLTHSSSARTLRPMSVSSH